MQVEEFIKTLAEEFEKNSDPAKAFHQKAYLKNKFKFYGITTPERREIQKPFLVKDHLPEKRYVDNIVMELWSRPHREFHYFAQELAFKYRRQIEKEDIVLYEYMVINNSWWDTVDFISTKLMGDYFKKYPEQIEKYIKKWLASGNMWLQRSALLFQLKYKKDLDEELMAYTINNLLGSKEFFINKAIGWLLREHSRTNPDWVIEFTDKTELSYLSKREALRLIM